MAVHVCSSSYLRGGGKRITEPRKVKAVVSLDLPLHSRLGNRTIPHLQKKKRKKILHHVIVDLSLGISIKVRCACLVFTTVEGYISTLRNFLQGQKRSMWALLRTTWCPTPPPKLTLRMWLRSISSVYSPRGHNPPKCLGWLCWDNRHRVTIHRMRCHHYCFGAPYLFESENIKNFSVFSSEVAIPLFLTTIHSITMHAEYVFCFLNQDMP